MRQKVKHRKLIRHSIVSFNRDVFSSHSKEEDQPESYSSAHASTLSQRELSQYLHSILTSNLPYYIALAKYTSKPFRIPRNGQDHKNHQLLSRLTVSGLTLLKTQFAKKPKNPV